MDRPLPKRRLGQNFLVDRGVVERIVDAITPTNSSSVVEIGPGDGALTARLLEVHGRLTAVEFDRGLAQRLRERFAGSDFRLFEQDILSTDLAALRSDTGGAPLTLIGNLPYNISKPIAMHLVRHRDAIAEAVLMFQREVADRLSAEPDSRAYGPLTVLSGACFRIERLFDVAPGCFRPRPRVISTVTRWSPREPGLPADEEPALRVCLATCFARRRQTLRNNLRARLGDAVADRLLSEAALDGTVRAETLEPQVLRRLARLWPEAAD